jgi:AcrR family transcriptional regulator
MTPVGERLAETAGRLFYARGIRAVGVELIAEEAGTTKKTLYDRFGSKDALVALYLRRRAERWQTVALDRLDRHPEPGKDRVLLVFDALDDWLSQQWRGCAFVNAYAEIGGTDHPGLPVVRAEKAWMRQLFVALVEEAGYDDPVGLGGQLHLLYEGAVVLLTAGDEPGALVHARQAAARLLG